MEKKFPSKKRRQSGFTLVEVALALIVFAMMTILFAAVFPMAVRGAQYSNNYAQAAMVADHKMDQLRDGGYGLLFNPSGNTGLISQNIIDSVNANGSYDFTTADNLADGGTSQGYFPAGSTGTITVSDYTTSGVPSGTMAYVTITIAWNGGGVSAGSYSLSSMISKAGKP